MTKGKTPKACVRCHKIFDLSPSPETPGIQCAIDVLCDECQSDAAKGEEFEGVTIEGTGRTFTVVVETGIQNYYGEIEVHMDEDGKFYLALENYDGVDREEISDELFTMLKDRFGPMLTEEEKVLKEKDEEITQLKRRIKDLNDDLMIIKGLRE